MDPIDLRIWPGFRQAGGNANIPAIIDQVAVDSRRIDSANALFVALEGTSSDGHRFISQAHHQGARYVLARNDRPVEEHRENLTILRVDSPLRALQEISAIYRKQLPCRVIGITGSYGKTMVKDLLLAMLKNKYNTGASPESFNSQLGVPLSLLTINKNHKIALIEAAISQENEMDLLSKMIQADDCIITHIGKKHLTTLKSLDVTAREMGKLQPQAEEGHWSIIPHDRHLLKHIRAVPSFHHFWNIDDPCLPFASFSRTERDMTMPYRIDFPDGQIFQGSVASGFYFFLDLLNITIKAAWLLGLSATEISNALQSYIPSPTRIEIWKSPIGTTFINDTYCSDPQSVDNSLKQLCQMSCNGRKIFAFGGMRGMHQHLETDYRRIGTAIDLAKVDQLVLFGQHRFEPLVEEMQRRISGTEISYCCTYDDAIQYLQTKVQNQDTVLIKGEHKYSFDNLTEKFHDSICSNQCMINLAAIAENISTIRSRLPEKTEVMVMVKAFAYGTDEVRIAKFLGSCGINYLGVSYVDEGVNLKRAGIAQSIFVINAAIYEIAKVVKWELEVGVSDKEFIEALKTEAHAQGKQIKVHLHINTGMGRFGCQPKEAMELAGLVLKSSSLILEGIMTHFTSADDPNDDAFTNAQAALLMEITKSLEEKGIKPKFRHAQNSSAIMRFHFPQFNMVRIGLAVYGLYASQTTREAMELRLALSLHSRIVGINTCNRGDTISYGRSYQVQEDGQRIAVLPIGYFDGLHRQYSGKGFVMIRGKKAPMVGKICMDFMMVDITNIPQAAVGDPVLFFGEDEHGSYLSPEELAMHGDSIIHELITCLGPRIQRVFVHEEAKRTY